MKECVIEKEEKDNLTILRLDGALDSHSCPKLEETLSELYSNSRNQIILDCERLNYLNSTAMGALIGFARRAREAEGGDMKLIQLAPKVQNIIQLLGFDKVLSIHEKLEEAAQEFTQTQS